MKTPTWQTLSRFTAKHSTVLACDVEGGQLEELPRVFAAALRSPKGNLTLALVNDAPRPWTVQLVVGGLAGTTPLYRYVVSAADRDNASLKIEAEGPANLTQDAGVVSDRLTPQSVTILTTYRLTHSDPGIMAE